MTVECHSTMKHGILPTDMLVFTQKFRLLNRPPNKTNPPPPVFEILISYDSVTSNYSNLKI